MVKSDDETDMKEKLFDGSDPGRYKMWKRRSQMWLLGLPSTIGPEKMGAKLVGLLRGKAEEDITDAILNTPSLKKRFTSDVEGESEIVVYELMDERYLPQKYAMLGEALSNYYDMSPIQKSESYRGMIQREELLHRKMKEVVTNHEEEARGWFMINKFLMLNPSQIADVMGYTKGDYSHGKVCEAVKFLFPNSMSERKPGRFQKKNDVLEADLESVSSMARSATSRRGSDGDDEDEEVFETLHEEEQDEGEDPDEEDGELEEEMADVMETWAQVRTKMREDKKGRGFKKNTKTTSTSYNKVEDEDYEVNKDKIVLCREKCGDARYADQRMDMDTKTVQSEADRRIRDHQIIKEIEDEMHVEVDCLIAEDDERRKAKMKSEWGGVLDTGCRKTVIGKMTLDKIAKTLSKTGRRLTTMKENRVAGFRFGDGQKMTTSEVAYIPVGLRGQDYILKTYVISGGRKDLPLLISKELMRALGVMIDTENDSMTMRRPVKMTTDLGFNERGHYVMPLDDYARDVGDTETMRMIHEQMLNDVLYCDGSSEISISSEAILANHLIRLQTAEEKDLKKSTKDEGTYGKIDDSRDPQDARRGESDIIGTRRRTYGLAESRDADVWRADEQRGHDATRRFGGTKDDQCDVRGHDCQESEGGRSRGGADDGADEEAGGWRIRNIARAAGDNREDLSRRSENESCRNPDEIQNEASGESHERQGFRDWQDQENERKQRTKMPSMQCGDGRRSNRSSNDNGMGPSRMREGLLERTGDGEDNTRRGSPIHCRRDDGKEDGKDMRGASRRRKDDDGSATQIQRTRVCDEESRRDDKVNREAREDGERKKRRQGWKTRVWSILEGIFSEDAIRKEDREGCDGRDMDGKCEDQCRSEGSDDTHHSGDDGVQAEGRLRRNTRMPGKERKDREHECGEGFTTGGSESNGPSEAEGVSSIEREDRDHSGKMEDSGDQCDREPPRVSIHSSRIRVGGATRFEDSRFGMADCEEDGQGRGSNSRRQEETERRTRNAEEERRRHGRGHDQEGRGEGQDGQENEGSRSEGDGDSIWRRCITGIMGRFGSGARNGNGDRRRIRVRGIDDVKGCDHKDFTRKGSCENNDSIRKSSTSDDHIIGTNRFVQCDDGVESQKMQSMNQLHDALLMCKESIHVLEVQHDECDARPHVMELWSIGRSDQHVKRHGLQTSRAVDILLGNDLLKEKEQEEVMRRLNEEMPYVVMLSPPCTAFSRLQDLFNKKKMSWRDWNRLQFQGKKHIRFACRVMRWCLEHDVAFIMEHPVRSRAWDLEMMKQIMRDTRVDLLELDQCMYGLEGPDDNNDGRYKKTTRIMTNVGRHAERYLTRRCDGKHKHQEISGMTKCSETGYTINRSHWAQHYPREMLMAITKTVKAVVVERKLEENQEVLETIFDAQEMTKEVMDMIRRVHINLGHPGKDTMMRMMRAAGASLVALEGTKRFYDLKVCDQCETEKLPRLHRRSKPRITDTFNVQVNMDVFHAPTAEGVEIPFLNMVDEGTTYQICVPLLKGVSSEAIRGKFKRYWCRPYGPPTQIYTDGGMEFEDEVIKLCEEENIRFARGAAYAPWHYGRCERHGGLWKDAWCRAAKEMYISTHEEVKLLADQINCQKNRLSRVNGHSPTQHVFGQDVKIPMEVISMRPDEAIPEGIRSALEEEETAFVRANNFRQAARRAICDADDWKKVRRAVGGRQRPTMARIQIGDQVYYWRSERAAGTTSRWHGPGTVIGKTEDQGKLWISVGSRVYRCAPEHVRFANEEERIAVDKILPELQRLGELVTQDKGPAVFVDMSNEPGAPDNQFGEDGKEAREDEAQRYEDEVQRRRDDGLMELEVTNDQGSEVSDDRKRRRSIGSSESSKKMDEEDLIATLTRGAEPVVGPGTGLRKRLDAFERMQAGIAEEKAKARQGVKERAIEKSDSAIHEKREVETQEMRHRRWEQDSEARRRAAEAMPTPPIPEESSSGSRSGTGSSSGQTSSSSSKESMKTSSDKDDETEYDPFVDEDAMLVEYDVYLNDIAVKGRKEVSEKNLEPMMKAKSIMGMKAEWAKLIKANALEIFGPDKARTMRKRIPQRRIIKSRFVLTTGDLEEDGYPKAKARWCLKGFLDPDLMSLEKCSPTMTKAGMNVILAFIAMKRWALNVMDVEGAFLQGDEMERPNGELYAELPTGGIPGVEDGSLIRLKKSVYGLCDAPVSWYWHFRKTLERLGMEVSKTDRCLFVYRNPETQKVDGLLGIHVDDCIAGGSKRFEDVVLKRLRQILPFKHWKIEEAEFLGRRIRQDKDGNIEVDQEQYTNEIAEIPMTRSRKKEKTARVTKEESREFRRVIGALNWIVECSRPDLAAEIAILQQCRDDVRVCDLEIANMILRKAKKHKESKIRYTSNMEEKDAMIMICTDASWANSEDCYSQGGYVMMLGSQKMKDGVRSECSPLGWKSFKLKRRTQSTLAAEAMALVTGLGEMIWTRVMWRELTKEGKLKTKELEEEAKMVMATAVADNKPIFDYIKSQGFSRSGMKDKRSYIDALNILEETQEGGVELRWVDTKQMLADGLTKMNADTTLLRMVVSGTPYGLKEEDEILKEKAEVKERMKQERKEVIQERKDEKERKKKNRQEKIRNKWMEEEKERKEEKRQQELDEELQRRKDKEKESQRYRRDTVEELAERFPYENKEHIEKLMKEKNNDKDLVKQLITKTNRARRKRWIEKIKWRKFQ